MYNSTLKVHGQYLAKDQALPQDTSIDGNGGPCDLSGTLGSMEIVAEAATEIGLSQNKNLEIILLDDTGIGTLTELGSLVKMTTTEETALPAGTILGRFVIPTDAGKAVQARIVSNDTSATGTLSIYAHYLAR